MLERVLRTRALVAANGMGIETSDDTLKHLLRFIMEDNVLNGDLEKIGLLPSIYSGPISASPAWTHVAM